MTHGHLSTFPSTTVINDQGHLNIGGCDLVDLAREFGTPLYIFDEVTLRNMCSQFRDEFASRYPNTQVLYASKAYVNPALARIFNEEGLGLDVVSGGELAVAQAADFPADLVYFHGNNKGIDELEAALDWGIGRIVVDNPREMDLIDEMARSRGKVQDILIRVSPGVDPHTHSHTTTGILDSKFGIPIETGLAEEAVKQAMSADNLRLVGLHFHLGSPSTRSSLTAQP